MAQRRINPHDYHSILDRVDILSLKIFNKILPGERERRKYYLAVFILAIHLLIYYLLSFLVGELEFFWINIYTYFAVVFAISFLLWAENWIGENIRKTFEFIQDHFNVEYDKLETHISRIYSPWRIVCGLALGLVFGTLGLLFVLDNPLAGHQAPIIKYNSLGLLVLIGVIFGEAGLGSILTVITQYLLLKDLSGKLNIVSKTHNEALKKVGEWGIQIALFLAIVSSITFLSILTNPFLVTLVIPLPLGLGLINNEVIISILFGFIGFVIFLILILTIIPISAISSNITAKKEEELRKISLRYEDIHHNMITNIENTSLQETQKQAQIITSLDVMEKKIQGVSTIPYGIKSVRRLIEAVLIPAITYLSQNLDLISRVIS